MRDTSVARLRPMKWANPLKRKSGLAVIQVMATDDSSVRVGDQEIPRSRGSADVLPLAHDATRSAWATGTLEGLAFRYAATLVYVLSVIDFPPRSRATSFPSFTARKPNVVSSMPCFSQYISMRLSSWVTSIMAASLLGFCPFVNGLLPTCYGQPILRCCRHGK